MFTPSYMFALLIWGAIGFALALYGWKQKAYAPLIGGILVMGASYFMRDAFSLSVVATILVVLSIGIFRRYHI